MDGGTLHYGHLWCLISPVAFVAGLFILFIFAIFAILLLSSFYGT
jgi:hypothetical protein